MQTDTILRAAVAPAPLQVITSPRNSDVKTIVIQENLTWGVS